MSEPLREERWVPVTQDGDRWAGRSKEEAEAAMRDFPAGGRYLDGSDWDGITHIEHEVRYVTEWRVNEHGHDCSLHTCWRDICDCGESHAAAAREMRAEASRAEWVDDE